MALGPDPYAEPWTRERTRDGFNGELQRLRSMIPKRNNRIYVLNKYGQPKKLAMLAGFSMFK